MRIIGMDIHRVAAEVVSLLDGEIVKLGRVPMLREKLEAFARKELTHDDHVVIEATGNAAAVVDVLSPHVDRVIIANPKQVRMIAHAKIKTDAIDAAVLAKLYATGFLPEVWVPDQRTLALRRQVTRRTQLVRQRVRAAARSPGPLRAFYRRLSARRGKHIAAVATARKLAMIIWHMLSKETDYIWVRPALLARKFRAIELRAGLPAEHAKRGIAYDYNIAAKRAEERSTVETAEAAYADLTSGWRVRPKRKKAVEKTAM